MRRWGWLLLWSGAAGAGMEDPAWPRLRESAPLYWRAPSLGAMQLEGLTDGRRGGVLWRGEGAGSGWRWRAAGVWRREAPVAYAPGWGRLAQGEARWRLAEGRLGLALARGVLGDYHVGMGPVLVVGGAGPARLPRGTVSAPLAGRVRLAPALRGVAWRWRGWEAALSWRLLDVYQYRLRYGPDAWSLDLLPPCTRAGMRRAGFVCDEAGRWYSHGVVDSAGRPRAWVTLPAAASERLAALAWRGRRWGVAVYGARWRWRLEAPALRLRADSPYGAAGRVTVAGLWRQGRATDWALMRAGVGGAGWWQGAWGRWRGALWYYEAAYRNPHGGGPRADPWSLRRDHRGARLRRTWGAGWRGAAWLWSRADGKAPAGALAVSRQGRRGQGALELRRRAEPAGRWRLTGEGGWRTRWGGGQGRLTVRHRRQWTATGAAAGWQWQGRVALRQGRWSLRAVFHLDDAAGRRGLPRGEGDRLSLARRGRSLAWRAWWAVDGRWGLWLAWRLQKRSKP